MNESDSFSGCVGMPASDTPQDEEAFREAAKEYFGEASVPATETITAGKKRCPWKIWNVEVGRTREGELMSTIWVYGYYPMAFEFPCWRINGNLITNKSWFCGILRIPDGRRYLKENESNKIRIDFYKNANAGTSDTYNFYYDPSAIKTATRHKF